MSSDFYSIPKILEPGDELEPDAKEPINKWMPVLERSQRYQHSSAVYTSDANDINQRIAAAIAPCVDKSPLGILYMDFPSDAMIQLFALLPVLNQMHWWR